MDGSSSKALTRRQLLRFGAAASLGAVALSVAACSGGMATSPTPNAAASSASSAGAAPTKAAAAAPAATTKPAAAGSGSLTWLVCDFSVGTENWFKTTFIPDFQKAHAGTEVNMLYVPWPNLAQKRDTMFAGGVAPDLLQSGAVMVVDYALKKLVRPADDYLKNWSDKSDYYPVSLKAATYDGKVYGIPARIDARAMIFREDLYKEKGLTLPTNWDELKKTALALTDKQGSNVTRLGYWLTFTNQQFFPAVWQNGGQVLSEDGRKPLFNSAEGVAALSYWVDFLDGIAPQGTQMSSSGPQIPLIAAGRIAGEMNGDGEMFNIVQFAPKIVSGVKVTAPIKQKAQTVNVFNNWYGITTQSKAPDLAWSMLTAFNAPDTLLAYDQTVSSLPPRQSLAKSSFVSDPKYQLTTFLDVVDKYAVPQPLLPNYAECWKTVDDALQAALRHQQTPQQALDAASARWQQLITDGYNGKT